MNTQLTAISKPILAILLAFVSGFFVVSPVRAANCSWTGAINTNWSNPGNWSNCGGLIPGSNDTATIPNSVTDPTLSTTTTIAGLTINNGGDLTIQAGSTLTVNGTVSLQGVLTGGGDLTVDGNMSWAAGTMSGSGATTILSGSSLTLSGSSKTLDGRTINNNGVATWIGATQIQALNGAVFNNLVGATFDMQNDIPFNVGSGGATFNNDGFVVKSGGVGTSNIFPVFNNNGTLEVQTNTLALAGGGSSNGTFSVLSGSTLRFEGSTHTLNSGSSLTGGGNLTIASATVVFNLNGDYDITGLATISGGTTNLDQNLDIPNLTLSGGTLQGSGTITVTNAFNWTGGGMAGSGITHVLAGTSFTIAGLSKTLDGRTLNNESTAVWSGITTVQAQGGAVINNLPGATFNIQADSELSLGAGEATFNNLGTLIKSAGSGTMDIAIPFYNANTVQIQSGTLNLAGGGTHSGAFQVAAGTTLRFDGTSHVLEATSSVSGAGNVSIGTGSVTVDFNGAYNIGGVTTVNGGTANFSSNETFPALVVSAGVLNSTATLTVTNSLNWTGGTLRGSGTTHVIAGATFTIGGVTKTLDGRALNNETTAVWSGITAIQAQGGAVINNLPGATFNIQADSSFNQGTGGATFNNLGTLVKSAGSGTMNMNVPFYNANTVQVQSGTLNLNGSGTHSGTFQVAAGATLRFDGTSHTLEATSAVSGAGNVSIGTSSVVVDFNGAYTIVGLTTVNGGTANFGLDTTFPSVAVSAGVLNSNATLTITNSLNWTGGTLRGSGTTHILAGATFTLGGVTKILDGRTLANYGTATWTGSTQIQGLNGAVFNNLGALNWQGDANFVAGSGGASFHNAGSLIKSVGTATSNMNAPFTNSGTVQASSGTLQFTNVTTTTGSLIVNSGGTVRFNSNSHVFETGSQVSGEGLVMIGTGASTITVQGDYNVSGTTTVNGGTAVFNAPATISTLNLSAGELQSTSAISVTGIFNWSGGRLTGSGATQISPGAILNLSGGTKIIESHTLNQAGSGSWAGTGALQGQNGATFNILPGASLDAQSDAALTGSMTFYNQGSFTKSAGSGNTTISIPLYNIGVVSVLTGTLQLNNNGSSDGTLTGAGSVIFGGNNTTFTITGSFDPNYVTVNSGAVWFNTDTTLSHLAVNNGTLGGSGTVTTTQSFTWSGGTLTGPGRNLVPLDASLTLNGNTKTLDGRTLSNAGHTTWDGSGRIQGVNGGVVNNLSGGTFTVTAGTATVEAAFTNDGTVQISGGTLQLSDAFNSGGTVTGPGSLTISQNATTVVISGTYQLTGTTTVAGGDVTLIHSQVALGDLVLSAGVFTLTNTLLEISGDFTRSGGEFVPNQNTVLFNGNTTQNLSLDIPTTFYHLTVLTGTTLIETSAADNAVVSGTLTNNGTIRKTLIISETGIQSFGLTAVTINVTTLGRLDSIQVDRIDHNHPNGTAQTATGRYWIITADGNNYQANLTLPHNVVPPKDAQVCRYTGSGWSCFRHAYTNTTVTLTNITTFSDWTVGTGPMYDIFIPLIQRSEGG